MFHSLIRAVCATSVVFGAFACATPAHTIAELAEPRAGTHEPAPGDSHERAEAVGSAGSLGQILFHDDELTLGVWNEGRSLRVIHREQVPAAPYGEERCEHPLTAAFDVDEVRARQSNELFLAGRDGREIVIERWWLEEPAGVRFAHLAFDLASDGTARTLVPTLVNGVVGGGERVPAAQRPNELAHQRRELFRGPLADRVLALLVDPEARYVLFVTHEPRAVYQLELADGARPHVVCDLASTPALARFERVTSVMQHVVDGRLCCLDIEEPRPEFGTGTGSVPYTHVVLRDSNNDGRFDDVFVKTQAEWTAASYDGAVWWRTDFNDWMSE